jgi:hypothetical protein
MLAFIFRLAYWHTCKKYLAAVRKYRQLTGRWA